MLLGKMGEVSILALVVERVRIWVACPGIGHVAETID